MAYQVSKLIMAVIFNIPADSALIVNRVDMGSRNVLLSIIITATVCVWNLCLGLDCLRCQGASSITSCSQIIQCADGQEKCYLDKVINPDLQVVFHAGCRAKQICDHVSGTGKRDTSMLYRSRKQLVACAQCCDGNMNKTFPCNGYLCDQRIQEPSSPICALCEATTYPDSCVATQECQPTEACAQKVLMNGYAIIYTLGCERKAVCDTFLEDFKQSFAPVGKRTNGIIQICGACCVGLNCNKENCDVLRRKQPCFNRSICG